LAIKVFSQQQTIDKELFLPPLDTLKKSLRIFYQIKSNAEEQEFKYTTKLNFLKYLPSIGYDAFRNAPIINLNTNSLYNEINAKRGKKAKLNSIQKINEVEFNRELSEVTFLVSIINRKIDYYNNQIELLTLETQRFDITKKHYQNKELLPSEFLSKQIDYLNFLNSIKQLELTINEMKDQLITKAKKTPYESLF
jgi:hypothetical protein